MATTLFFPHPPSSARKNNVEEEKAKPLIQTNRPCSQPTDLKGGSGLDQSFLQDCSAGE
jgi:hypothetical protein